jgi:hypothetical protein
LIIDLSMDSRSPLLVAVTAVSPGDREVWLVMWSRGKDLWLLQMFSSSHVARVVVFDNDVAGLPGEALTVFFVLQVVFFRRKR